MHDSIKQAKIFLKRFYYTVNVIKNILGDLVPGESKSYSTEVGESQKAGQPWILCAALRIKLKPLNEASFWGLESAPGPISQPQPRPSSQPVNGQNAR